MDIPIFSTSGGDNRKKNKENTKKGYTKGNGPIKIRLEKKKRAGKLVTVCSDLPLSESEAKELLKNLKASLGTGGSLKESNIEIQGDRCKDIASYLKGIGTKHKIC